MWICHLLRVPRSTILEDLSQIIILVRSASDLAQVPQKQTSLMDNGVVAMMQILHMEAATITAARLLERAPPGELLLSRMTRCTLADQLQRIVAAHPHALPPLPVT